MLNILSRYKEPIYAAIGAFGVFRYTTNRSSDMLFGFPVWVDLVIAGLLLVTGLHGTYKQYKGSNTK